MPANLPGFYFDEQRNRYFPVTSRGRGAPSVLEPSGKPGPPVPSRPIVKKGHHGSVQHRIREVTTGLYASQQAKALRCVILLSPPTQALYPSLQSRSLYMAFATRKGPCGVTRLLMNTRLHDLVGLPRKTWPERLKATPCLGYILRRVIVTHAHFC